MAGVLQHLRSSTLDKRPNPASMVDGQVAINYASGSPGMFFKDSNGSLVKVGPVHVGSTAPNVSPASGGTAGNSIGEQWLDNSGGTYVFKIWDGSAWRSEAGEFVNATGDTMTGDLVMNNANVVFEGSVDDGFETTLTVVNPTADRTITLPNVTGTVVTTGDSGTVTSTMIANSTIVNADVNASAAIAGTKISPDFGSQTIKTTGIISAASGSAAAPSIAFTGDTNTGIYSPGADQVAISTNGTGRLFVDASGNVGVGTVSPFSLLHVNAGFALGSLNADADDFYVSNPGDVGMTLGAGASNKCSIFFGKSGIANNRGRIIYDNNDDSLQFYTAAAALGERARIDSSGRLGLGTSSPQKLFELAANNNGVAENNTLRFTDTDTSAEANQQIGRIEFYSSDSSGSGANVKAYIGAFAEDTTPDAYLAFATQDESGVSTPVERLRITSDGNVGIGTATPQESIHSTGNIRFGDTSPAEIYTNSAELRIGVDKNNDNAASDITFYVDNSERARIDSSGRLGLGTSSPDELLHIEGDTAEFKGTNTNQISDTAGTEQVFKFGIEGQKNGVYGPAGSIIFRQDNNTWSSVDTNNKATRIEFCTQDTSSSDTSETPRLVINKDGNVGIGTTSPSELLTVEGNIRIGAANKLLSNGQVIIEADADNNNASNSDIIFQRDGGQESARIDSSGRLLVGTSTARIFDSATATLTPLAQLEDTGSGAAFSVTRNSANSSGPGLFFGKSRSGSIGGTTVVQDSDKLGTLFFEGSDGTNLIEAASIGAEVDGTPGANDMPGRLVFSTTADGSASPTERMRIGSDGFLSFAGQTGTGISSPASNTLGFSAAGTEVLRLTSGGRAAIYSTDSNACRIGSSLTSGTADTFLLGQYGATAVNTGTTSFRVYTNGNVENTNNSYGALSDIKLKENIVDANSQWDDLKAFQVRNYNFKEGQTHTQIGLIAQEVELVSPGLVSESPDRDAEGNDLGTVTKSVNYSVLYMKAVKALQEAMERIEVLEAKVNALEGH